VRRVTAEFAAMARSMGVDGQIYCGNMPPGLCADVPGSRVAKLSNALFQGLPGAGAGADASAADGDGSAAGDAAGGANVDRPYGDGDGTGSADAAADGDGAGDWAGDAPDGASVADAVARAGGGTAVEKELRVRLLASTPSYMLDVGFFNYPTLRAACIPSANGHFSARALARLYAALADDGAVGGAPLVAPGRVAQMMGVLWVDPPAGAGGADGAPPAPASSRPSTTNGGAARDDGAVGAGADGSGSGADGDGGLAAVFSDGAAWGAGLRLYDTVSRRGVVTPRAALGHSGIGGSSAFAVPGRRRPLSRATRWPHW